MAIYQHSTEAHKCENIGKLLNWDPFLYNFRIRSFLNHLSMNLQQANFIVIQCQWQRWKEKEESTHITLQAEFRYIRPMTITEIEDMHFSQVTVIPYRSPMEGKYEVQKFVKICYYDQLKCYHNSTSYSKSFYWTALIWNKWGTNSLPLLCCRAASIHSKLSNSLEIG